MLLCYLSSGSDSTETFEKQLLHTAKHTEYSMFNEKNLSVKKQYCKNAFNPNWITFTQAPLPKNHFNVF